MFVNLTGNRWAITKLRGGRTVAESFISLPDSYITELKEQCRGV